MVMRGAVRTMTRAGPIRVARAESTMVSSASSTIVAVKTAPIWAADRPRFARYKARTTESQPKPKARTALAAKSSHPSRDSTRRS